MPLTINGTTHADGAPTLVNGAQASSITVNGVQVWVNNYVSDAPTSFTASVTATANIDFTWVLPADQGVPSCSYSIRDDGGTEVATAAVGATTAQFVTTSSQGRTYHVVGINAAGDSLDSNTDAGSSYVGAASPVDFTSSDTYTAGIDFPAGVTVNVDILGGGGGGAASALHSDNETSTCGGWAGDIVSTTANKAFNDPFVIAIGAGGAGVHSPSYSGGTGGSGGDTTADGVVAGGGTGGTYTNNNGCDGASYSGSGSETTTVFGTGYDGTGNGYGGGSCGHYARGGQSSGASDAGDGDGTEYGNNTGGAGGTGSGGGGATSRYDFTVNSGAGGSGMVRISW